LNLVQLVGWGAFEIIIMRDAASLLATRAFGEQSGWVSPALWTLFFGALATLLAITGPLTFVRRILRKWGIWLLLGACVWLTWNLLDKADLRALWARQGDGSLPFALGFDIAIAMPLSWLPLIADYSRFGKVARRVFGGTVLGFFIGNVWLMSLGVAYTLAFADSGEVNALLLALAGAGLGIPLLLILRVRECFCRHPFGSSLGWHTAAVQGRAAGFGHWCAVHLDRLVRTTGGIPELPAADRLGIRATVWCCAGGSLPAQKTWPAAGGQYDIALGDVAGVGLRRSRLPFVG